MKPAPSLPVIAIMLAALAVIAAAAWIAWSQIAGDRPVAGGPGSGVVQTSVKIGGPFELTNHRGETVTDADFRGRFMLVFFGYGHCPDICPLELSNMVTALDLMREKAAAVQPIFITVDPMRDTAEFLSDYVQHFHPQMVGLTGTEEQIKDIAKAYRVFYAKAPPRNPAEAESEEDYLVDHSTFVYLMGPDGNYVSMFRHKTDPAEMAKTLIQFVESNPNLSLKGS